MAEEMHTFLSTETFQRLMDELAGKVETRYEKGDREEATRVAWESSPDASVDGWKSPVLLIQGDDDRNVPFQQTVDLARRLRMHDVPFEEIVIPNEIHGFLRGATWTIDTPYRETIDEVRHYRSEGVLTVEMEAAALFAVATVRGATAASAFVLSDLLGETEWTPEFSAENLNEQLQLLADAGAEAITTFDS